MATSSRVGRPFRHSVRRRRNHGYANEEERMDQQMEGASWIARPVSPAQRTVRQIKRSQIDWVEPGHTLGQHFTAEGPVVAVNIDLASIPFS